MPPLFSPPLLRRMAMPMSFGAMGGAAQAGDFVASNEAFERIVNRVRGAA